MKRKLFIILFLFTSIVCYARDFHTRLISDDNSMFAEIAFDIHFRNNTFIIKVIENSKTTINWTFTEITEEEANELFGYLYNNCLEKDEYIIDDEHIGNYILVLGLLNGILTPLLDEENKLNISYKEFIEWGESIGNPFEF